MRSLSNTETNHKKHIALYIFLTIFFYLQKNVYAESNVIINEFQTLPSQKIEVLNLSSHEIDISGYYLDDSGGTTYYTIPQNTRLLPYQCIVFQSNFNLNTASPDIIRLFDSTSPPTQSGNVLIDSFSYSLAPSEGSSYSRNPDGTGSFAIGVPTFSSYNTSGINCVDVALTNTPTPTPTAEVVPTPSLTPTIAPTTTPTQIIYKNNIYLSEVLPNPTSGGEWVEIYNANLEQVILNGWSIDDFEDSGASPQKFSTTISPSGYAVIEISSSMLNNDSDLVRLLDENNNEIGMYMYSSSLPGISWGTADPISSQIFCIQEPSKSQQNNSCIEVTKTQTPTPTKTLTPTKTPTTSPTPTQAPINYSGIYISEFLARADEANPDEWVEIYNDNRYPVTLKNWSVGDATTPQAQSFTVDIDAYRFAIIDLSSSRFNNSGDTVYLSDEQDKIIDSFSYSETETATSWGRKPGDFDTWCMQTPSKDDFNTSCIDLPTQTPTKTPTSTKTVTPTKTPTKTPTQRISNKQAPTESLLYPNSSILGVVTTKELSPIQVAFTPRSNSENVLPFTFSVNAQSNETQELDADPDANTESTLSVVDKNPILSLVAIVLCSFVAGIMLFDLFRIWKMEKLGDYDS